MRLILANNKGFKLHDHAMEPNEPAPQIGHKVWIGYDPCVTVLDVMFDYRQKHVVVTLDTPFDIYEA